MKFSVLLTSLFILTTSCVSNSDVYQVHNLALIPQPSIIPSEVVDTTFYSMQIFAPDSSIDYEITVLSPNPAIDYKIIQLASGSGGEAKAED